MRNKLLWGFIVVMAIAACEKNEPEVIEPPVQEPDYFPLTIGSYWVYNTYEIDSLGNETLISENDTIEIIDSTIINNKVYRTFYGKRYGTSSNKEEQYFRDSNEYIVRESGTITFSQYNFTDTLSQTYINPSDPIYYWFSMMKEEVEEVQVPAGTYDSVLNCNLHFKYLKDSNNLTVDTKKLHAPNVGKVLKQYIYASKYEFDRTYLEERLVAYHIAEDKKVANE